MAASPYDVGTLGTLGNDNRRRFSLARLRAGGLGGGLALVIVGIGLLVIGIGWNGMAGGGGEINGVPNLNAQLPWLVSGGILGLALVVFGAAMLVVHNARTDRAHLEAKLDELVATLSRSGVPAPAYPQQAAPARTSGLVVAGGAAYHRQDCRLVQGRDEMELVTTGDAEARAAPPLPGVQAGRVAHPLRSSRAGRGAVPASPGTASPGTASPGARSAGRRSPRARRRGRRR